jgi:hypothetical protein
MRRAVLAVMVGRVATVHADSATVTVTLTPQGQTLAQNFGDSEAQLIAKVQSKIDEYYQLARVGTLLREFVDATSFVNRDLGVDYAIRTGDLVFGVVADAAIAADAQLSSTGHVTAGTAVNLAVTAGANLARWGLPRWSVYGNGFYESGTLHDLDGHLTSAAAHVQVRAIAPEPSSRAVQWIGLDVGSGIELTRWTLGAARPITTKFTLQGTRPGTSMNLTVVSTGSLSLVADTFTIPLEVSTGIRLGALAVFVGGGTDLSIGSSTLGTQLDGEMTITSDGTDLGHVTITASGGGSPTPLALRALGGLQLDVPHASLFVQGNATSAASAVSLGLRVVL